MGIKDSLVDAMTDPWSYTRSDEWRQRQMVQRVLTLNPKLQGATYSFGDKKDARQRMDERLGIPECDLSWLDATRPPLEDR